MTLSGLKLKFLQNKKKKRAISAHAAINYKGKLLNDQTPFAVAEAFKSMRTNLLYTTNQKCPIFGIVSSYQATGKSLIAANLAIAFSQMNKRTLLVDGDMRKPVQHRCFGFKHPKGLSELLSGQCSIEEAIAPVPQYENLYLIQAGNIPPNPQELLAYEQTPEIFNALREQFDYIIVDLPPAGVVADAMAISSVVTGYVFVVRSGASDVPTVRDTIESMKQMNCNIIGTVLNGFDIKSDNYYRNKDKKYGRYNYYRRDMSSNKDDDKSTKT